MDSRSSRSPDWEHHDSFADRIHSVDGKPMSTDPMLGDGLVRQAVNRVIETVLKILNHLAR